MAPGMSLHLLRRSLPGRALLPQLPPRSSRYAVVATASVATGIAFLAGPRGFPAQIRCEANTPTNTNWQRLFGCNIQSPTLLKKIAPGNEKGRTLDFHAVSVLEEDPKFKGAVWAPIPPDGVVMFHNSVFSNWYPFNNDKASPGRFNVMHKGQLINFGNSEAVIMAVKERIASRGPLGDILVKHAALDGGASKASAAMAGNAYPLWGDHTFQVLLGATAVLLKFSQSVELQESLMKTGKAVLVECAPNDGAWGVAKNHKDFLDNEKPEHYSLQSTEETEISFNTGEWSGTRKRRDANALGKALMLARGVLQGPGAPKEPTLRAALDAVCEELQRTPGHGLQAVNERIVDCQRLFE